MSLSQALSTSVAGLRTTQAGLALVAANVANAETPGYVRKTLVQATSSAGANGVSVRVAAIAREFDQYLQRQMRVESSGGAYADLRAQFYSRLQQVYGVPGATSALETAFNNMTAAAQALSTSPESVPARSALLSAAQVLAQQLNSMTADIQALRSDAENGLNDAVSRANNAMAQIAAINRQLATSNGNDAAAATLLDQRDAYIDQLSQLMDIKVVLTDHNQANIFTNSGIQLVGTQASMLAFDPQGTMTASAQWSADPDARTVGTLMLVSPTGGSMDLVANKAIRSGEIAAYLEMRDQVLVQAQQQLDSFAAAMAQTLSDRTYEGEVATDGAQQGFDIDAAGLLAGNSINLTWTDTTTGQQRQVTIVRVDDPDALPLSNNVTAKAGDQVIGVDFSGGLASVVAQLNSHFNGKVNFSNPFGTTLRILDDGAANNSSVDAVSAVKTMTGFDGGSGELPFFTDAFNPYTGAITGNGAQVTGLAGRIVVNPALINDPSKLVIYQSGTPSGDGLRPDFLLNRLTSASQPFSADTGIGTAASPFVGSLSSFLRIVISVQGEAAANAQSLAEGQAVVVSALKERVAEGTGVNIDAELSNLLNLQTAYGANARVLSTVKEMLDMLMKV
ncbi:MAG: flagellar hook-associated protein FlgK [Pseudorhodoplanes sp.]|nr:flagellar hook-associated protein FlgK [Pseudorhodoplanes sp.]